MVRDMLCGFSMMVSNEVIVEYSDLILYKQQEQHQQKV